MDVHVYSASHRCFCAFPPNLRDEVECWVLSRGQEVPAKLWTLLDHEVTRALCSNPELHSFWSNLRS